MTTTVQEKPASQAGNNVDSRIQEAIAKLLEDFKEPDSLQRIARHAIPALNVPSASWSWLNRLLVEISGSMDARGFRQWQRVGRQVKRGAKAIRILAPRMLKITKKIKDTTGHEVEEERTILKGWLAIPVFRVEDTIGKPLDYPKLEPPSPPPLMDVAERFGLRVRYAPFLGSYYGYFSEGKKEIVLNSHDSRTFLHELAHGAHARISTLKQCQDPGQEIIAEFSAAVLGHLYGIGGHGVGTSYDYVALYAKKLGKEPATAIFQLLGMCEKVIKSILNTSHQSQQKPIVVG